MMLIRCVLPVVALASTLFAQEDRLNEREQRMERRMRERAEQGEKDGSAEEKARLMRGDGEEKEVEDLSHLTPEERLARSVRHNASAFCRFVASVKPAKLLPGQSGTLVVSALLSGQAVLPSPAPMSIVGSRQQGFVTLGELQFRPAEMGRHAAGYQGRPVYDNYAIFEIPFTVGADVAMGAKQNVNVDLQFDIYDGFSAQPIGRFIDRFVVEVEIGTVPDPIVVASSPSAATTQMSGVAATVEVDGDTAPSSAPPGATERVVTGLDPVGTPAPAAVVEEDATDDHAAEPDWSHLQEDSGALPWPVWFGGGFLLLGLVVLLARKK